MPRLYEMPKKGNPLRMIVLSPLYPLAFFLKISLTKNLRKRFRYIKNSWELVNQLNSKVVKY